MSGAATFTPALSVVVINKPMFVEGTVRHPRTQLLTSNLTKSSFKETAVQNQKAAQEQCSRDITKKNE